MLLCAAFAVAQLLPSHFLLWLLFYVASTLLYSMYLKRIALLDVPCAVRALHAAPAGRRRRDPAPRFPTGSPDSPSSCFYPLPWSSALPNWETRVLSGVQLKNGRGYLMTDLEQLRSFGTASAFAAVVVFATTSAARTW